MNRVRGSEDHAKISTGARVVVTGISGIHRKAGHFFFGNAGRQIGKIVAQGKIAVARSSPD